MPRRPTIARKTKYAEQLTGTALTLDQFTNKLMHGGKRHLAHRILEDALAIVGELQNTLNVDAGGDLAAELDRLYSYIFME